MARFSLICCVVNTGNASKILRLAKEYGIKGGTMWMGRGTLNNRLLEFLGLNEVRKEIISMIAEQEVAARAIQGISEKMEFHKPNHGIAFSLSVTEFVGKRTAIGDIPKVEEVVDNMYQIIYVVVDKGKAEDVIDAAKEAGARGGTIINARGSGIHETQKLFSVAIEPEKDVVFVIAKKELKDGIVESIKSRMKIEEPGRGILFVMDVDEAYGLC